MKGEIHAAIEKSKRAVIERYKLKKKFLEFGIFETIIFESKYGIVDGKYKTFDEVAEEYGINPKLVWGIHAYMLKAMGISWD